MEGVGEGCCVGSHGVWVAEHVCWLYEKAGVGGVSVWWAVIPLEDLSSLKE